ncbi:sensor histidine kinase [Prolixibacteraceae bacterium JC049]|nr:sensor histidine kinase [Prolixibacteraceae bacterium JC049]
MVGSEETQIIIILFLGTIGMMVLAVGVFVFFVTYKRRLLEKELQINKIKSEQQKQLLSRSIEAQESERKRIAEDLHDDVGAALSAVALGLSLVERKVNEKEKELLVESKNHVHEVITDIRRISRDLLPPSIERFGLYETLGEMANRFNQTEKVKVSVWLGGENKRFDVRTELMIYRIIRELVNNSIKHSRSESVNVKIRFCGYKLWLSVLDEGIGFDVNKVMKGGFGLTSVQSRVEVLGAKSKTISKKDKGTTTIMAVNIQNDSYGE